MSQDNHGYIGYIYICTPKQIEKESEITQHYCEVCDKMFGKVNKFCSNCGNLLEAKSVIKKVCSQPKLDVGLINQRLSLFQGVLYGPEYDNKHIYLSNKIEGCLILDLNNDNFLEINTDFVLDLKKKCIQFHKEDLEILKKNYSEVKTKFGFLNFWS